MRPRPSPSLGLTVRRAQSPLESSDYAGLQLDTEAQARNRREDAGEPPRSMEKSAAYPYPHRTGLGMDKGLEAAASDEEPPSRPAPSYEPPIPRLDGAMKETLSPGPRQPAQGRRRVCGLNRRTLIALLVAVLIVVIVAAVVGGVVGSRNAASSSTGPAAPSTTDASRPAVTPTTDPGAVNGGLP